MDSKRNIWAALLIFVVFYVFFLSGWFDAETEQLPGCTNPGATNFNELATYDDGTCVLSKPTKSLPVNPNVQPLKSDFNGELIDITTTNYNVKISPFGGGTIVEYRLNKKNEGVLKYKGSYDESFVYNKESAVMLQHNLGENACSPCIKIANDVSSFNEQFTLNERGGITHHDLGVGEASVVLIYRYDNVDNGDYIYKTMTFSNNSYIIRSTYDYNLSGEFGGRNIELIWDASISPAELNQSDELNYSGAYVHSDGDYQYIYQTDEERVAEDQFGGADWMAVRNKFFGIIVKSENKLSNYSKLSSTNMIFGDREITPDFVSTLGYNGVEGELNISTYLGPLDIYQLEDEIMINAPDLMNFGSYGIQYFSVWILKIIKYVHDLAGGYVPYGFLLIGVAFVMRVVTSPLTKKSFESQQKMKLVTPLQQKLQEKHKDDPKRLQQEMSALWKEHGVNPISGCLPMLLQWPILMSFFIVFRTTVEFRGSSFIPYWITDLSLPDHIIKFPNNFSIPMYGDGIGVLPILMGISMFLTMRMSLASSEGSQKTMMYFMNGFFVIIFNSFPSGLTLYYTVYNFLSFQQQWSLQKKLQPSLVNKQQ